MVEMVSRLGWIYGFVLGGLHYRKSDVQGRMFDLSWGVCKTNGGNGVQGRYVGLSWGVFTSDVQGRMFDLSWGGVRGMVEMVSRVDIWVCLGGSSLQKK